VTSSLSRQRYKTAVIKKSLEPLWNEEFQFIMPQPHGHIFIKCWDRDRWTSDDFLGEISIDLEMLRDQEEVEGWFPLHDEPSKKKLGLLEKLK